MLHWKPLQKQHRTTVSICNLFTSTISAKKNLITARKPTKILIFFHHNQSNVNCFSRLKHLQREKRTKTVQQQTLHSGLTFLSLVTNQTAVVNAKNNTSASKRTAYDVQMYFRFLIKTERRRIPLLRLVHFHRSRLRPTRYKNEVSHLLKMLEYTLKLNTAA